MKRAIIIHGWEGSPSAGWLPWLAEKLKKDGYTVIAPQMPNADHPALREWLEVLEQQVGAVDTDTHFFGHSLGCYAIAKFLESRDVTEKAGSVIFVAGFSGKLNIPEIENFYATSLNWERIKHASSGITAIYSEKDPYVPIERAQELHDKLGARLVKCNEWKHFSGSEGIYEFPLLINEFIRSNSTEFLRMAIKQSEESVETGCFPAGAIVIESGEVVSSGISDMIDYGHAERNAVDSAVYRNDGRKLLENGVLCASLEPCLMCFLTALHGGINTFVFACEKAAVRPEYYESKLSLVELVQKMGLSKSVTLIHVSDLQEEALEIIQLWEEQDSPKMSTL